MCNQLGLAAALALTILLGAPPATGALPPSGLSKMKAEYARGYDLFDEAKNGPALKHFRAAYRLAPPGAKYEKARNALRYYIGMCLHRLKKPVPALKVLSAFLRRTGRAADRAIARDTVKLIRAELKARRPKPTPVGSRQPPGPPESVETPAGHGYKPAVVRSPGKQPRKVSRPAAAAKKPTDEPRPKPPAVVPALSPKPKGGPTRLGALPPSPVAVRTAPGSKPARPMEPSGPRKRNIGVLPWVTLGLGVAALSAGVGFGILTRKSLAQADDAASSGAADEFVAHDTAARRGALTANVLFLSGGALVAAGGIWALVRGLRRPSSGVSVGVSAGARGAVVSVRGRL